jgi:hypothetical protein
MMDLVGDSMSLQTLTFTVEAKMFVDFMLEKIQLQVPPLIQMQIELVKVKFMLTLQIHLLNLFLL